MVQIIELGECTIQANNRIAIRNDIVEKYDLKQGRSVIVDLRIPEKMTRSNMKDLRQEKSMSFELQKIIDTLKTVKENIDEVLNKEGDLTVDGRIGLDISSKLLYKKINALETKLELFELIETSVY